ncbi:armadillo-type protein [Mycena latifolia]|nr:armadillo-type protein [Mycena latifolia]
MSPKGAQLLDSVVELLDSPSTVPVARVWACEWLAKLARQEATRDVVSRVKPCVWLVSLLREKHPKVIESAAQALYSIAGSPKGAQAAVDANVLDCVPKLLESSGALVWSWIYNMLEQLAYQQSTAMTVIRVLISLLHGKNLAVIECTTKLLYRITTSPQGAQIAVDANVLACVDKLLGSPNAMVWRWTCDMLEQLADEQTTVRAVVSHLVFLLRRVSNIFHRNPAVVESVTMMLYRIAWSTEGAQEALQADMLHRVGELLDSPNPEVRKWMCKMLALLTPHLVSLLRNRNLEVIQAASYEINGLADSVEGARAVVEAQILDCVGELLGCPDALVRKRTCQTLGKIARHDDENLEVVESAVYALLWIAKSPEGAQAVIEADGVVALVELPNTVALDRRCAAKILGHLAYQKTTRLAVSTMQPCQQLVSRLRDNIFEVVLDTICALYWIAWSLEGAQAVVGARVLDFVPELLESPNTNVCGWTWSMLGRVACHKPTATAVLAVIPCCRLVPLLHGGNLAVAESVAKVLYGIARSPEGAQAVLELVHVGALLASPSGVVRRWMCAALGELVWQESTRDAVLRINPCPQLVSLLRFPEGAQAVMEAKIMDVEELLASENTWDREEGCLILTLLASQDPCMPALIRLKLFRMLVSLLGRVLFVDEDLYIVREALHGLCYIIGKSPEWAQTVVDANMLKCIKDLELLDSPNVWVKTSSCAILHQLSSYETTAAAVLDINPCGQLVYLCRHGDFDLRASALFALEKISESQAGAASVAATDILGRASDLIRSPDREIRLRTRKLLKNLTRLQASRAS